MCGGEDSGGERTGEGVMIYSWRTWLGLSRAAVREERWRWRPGLDQEATGARQLRFPGQLRANASRTTYFLPPRHAPPISHHFFSRADTTGSITATFPRIRPVRRCRMPSRLSHPRHPATPALVPLPASSIPRPRPAIARSPLASMHVPHASRRRPRAARGPMTAPRGRRRMGSHLITATLKARDGEIPSNLRYP